MITDSFRVDRFARRGARVVGGYLSA